MPSDQPTEDAVLLQLTTAAGVDLAPIVYSKLIALIRMNVPPVAIAAMLKQISVDKQRATAGRA